MARARATDAEKAYWRRLAQANARLDAPEPPATSIDDVFARMAAIRAQLGELATPGREAEESETDERAMAEHRRVRELLLRKSRARA